MPASSKSQQRFFGVVKAMQKGDLPKTGKAGKVAKSMTKKDVDDFASTKHKGKPEKVKREMKVRNLIKKMVREEIEETMCFDLQTERCWKGYTQKGFKTMFGKRYPNCVKKENVAPNHDGKAAPHGSGYKKAKKLKENKIYSKADGLKKVKSVSKKGKVYKVDKQKAKYDGKNITMYTLYTKYKNHTSGQNPFGLDMARNSKGEAMYLVPIKEGKLTEKKMDRKKAAIILKQIGGNRFIAMTGAKDFAFSDKYMSFKIGRNSKGINFVRIAHNAMDTYDMEFGFVSIKGIKVKKKVKGVYADMLGTMFKKYTGMNVSL